MHHLILNIGLGPPIYSKGGPGDPVARFEAASKHLGLHGRIGAYDTPLDKLGEPVLVVHWSTEHNLDRVLTALSTAAGQDCIAAWNCDTGEGSLYGLFNLPWQPFRLDLFLTLPTQGEHQ